PTRRSSDLDPTLSMFNNAALFIKLNFWDSRTKIADRTVYRLNWVHLHFAGPFDVAGAVQFHALHAYASDLTVFSPDFFWGFYIVQVQSTRSASALWVIVLF